MQAETASLVPYADGFTRSIDDVYSDLIAFTALIEKWQRVQNLVSRETGGELWSRHILDSLQLLPLLPTRARTVVDLGSGGGFPAIPMAIGRKGASNFHLIESNRRKVAFLRAAARDLDLPVTVHASRIEDNASHGFRPDVVTARALAPLPALLRLLQAVWAPGCVALLPKGREVSEEIADCRANWRFRVVQHRSRTDDSGVILEVRDLAPA